MFYIIILRLTHHRQTKATRRIITSLRITKFQQYISLSPQPNPPHRCTLLLTLYYIKRTNISSPTELFQCPSRRRTSAESCARRRSSAESDGTSLRRRACASGRAELGRLKEARAAALEFRLGSERT